MEFLSGRGLVFLKSLVGNSSEIGLGTPKQSGPATSWGSSTDTSGFLLGFLGISSESQGIQGLLEGILLQAVEIGMDLVGL